MDHQQQEHQQQPSWCSLASTASASGPASAFSKSSVTAHGSSAMPVAPSQMGEQRGPQTTTADATGHRHGGEDGDGIDSCRDGVNGNSDIINDSSSNGSSSNATMSNRNHNTGSRTAMSPPSLRVTATPRSCQFWAPVTSGPAKQIEANTTNNESHQKRSGATAPECDFVSIPFRSLSIKSTLTNCTLSTASSGTISQPQSPDADASFISNVARFTTCSPTEDLEIVQLTSPMEPSQGATSTATSTATDTSTAINPFLINVRKSNANRRSPVRFSARASSSSPEGFGRRRLRRYRQQQQGAHALQQQQQQAPSRPKGHRRRVQALQNVVPPTIAKISNHDDDMIDTGAASALFCGQGSVGKPDYLLHQQEEELQIPIAMTSRRVSDDSDACKLRSLSADSTGCSPGTVYNMDSSLTTSSAHGRMNGGKSHSRREKRRCSQLTQEIVADNPFACRGHHRRTQSATLQNEERLRFKRRRTANRHRALGATDFDAILTQIIPSTT